MFDVRVLLGFIVPFDIFCPAPLCVSNIIEPFLKPLLIEGCHPPIVVLLRWCLRF